MQDESPSAYVSQFDEGWYLLVDCPRFRRMHFWQICLEPPDGLDNRLWRELTDAFPEMIDFLATSGDDKV